MSGQDQENAYFYDINRELIEHRRQLLDRMRANQRGLYGAKGFWLKCPKCGGRMVESQALKIDFEQCMQCHGVYFDAEEFRTLLKAKEPKRFFDYLQKAFKPNENWLPDL